MHVLIDQTNVYKTYKNEVNTIIKLVSHYVSALDIE